MPLGPLSSMRLACAGAGMGEKMRVGRGGVDGRRDARRYGGDERKITTTRGWRRGAGARRRTLSSLELLDLHLLVLVGQLGGLVHLGDVHAVLQRRLLGLLLARVGSLPLVALALLRILLGLRHRGRLEARWEEPRTTTRGLRRRREIHVGVFVHHGLALPVDGHGVRRCEIAKERFFLKATRIHNRTFRHRPIGTWKDLSCSIRCTVKARHLFCMNK